MKSDDLKTILSQALARGYCHDANANKTLDAELIFAMVDEAIEVLKCETEIHEMMSAIFRNLKEIKNFIEIETITQPNVYMFIHARILNLFSELEHVNIFLNDLNRRSNKGG